LQEEGAVTWRRGEASLLVYWRGWGAAGVAHDVVVEGYCVEGRRSL
jgi:hypothetical protein